MVSGSKWEKKIKAFLELHCARVLRPFHCVSVMSVLCFIIILGSMDGHFGVVCSKFVICSLCINMRLCACEQLLRTFSPSGTRVCGSASHVKKETRSFPARFTGGKNLAVFRWNGLVYVWTVFIGQCCLCCLAIQFGIFEHTSTCERIQVQGYVWRVACLIAGVR